MHLRGAHLSPLRGNYSSHSANDLPRSHSWRGRNSLLSALCTHGSMVDVGVPVQILVPRRKREPGSSGACL